MFICGRCSKQSEPREKPTRVITQFRTKEYYDKQGRYEGRGFEPVSEQLRCADCAEREL
jgi:cytochrome c-type biogenesis protein CcmH/NrfF